MRSTLASGLLLTCGLLRGQTATTTTLTSVTPSTTARFGQAVSLAAQVAPSAALGTVSFVDRGVLVGVATLRSGGVATITTITLPAGSHAFQAIYGGGTGYLASHSAITNYSVTAVAGSGFNAPANYSVSPSTELSYVAVADFNGDGKADLATLNWNSNGSVSVALGNGQGSFQSPTDYPVGQYPSSVVAGDFNGDGKLDLAVANDGDLSAGAPPTTVSVLLGKGDGTFQPATSFSVAGYGAFSIAIGDFNGDGKADLAVANIGSPNAGKSASLSVLLGRGDGTFQPAFSYPANPGSSFVTVSDFNGDGVSDLVLANNAGVSVLLGNGDGSFRAGQTYPTGGSAAVWIAVSDFNGDGKADLAVVGSGKVNVLLGNGDGTFQAAVQYAAGTGAYSIAVGDFNGDGVADLVVANDGGNSVSVLFGNGNGTFQAAVNYDAGDIPSCLAVADFNGDGVADLVLSNSANTDVTVLIGSGPGTPTGTPTATTISSTPNPSQFGQPVTLTADVTPSSVTGQVEFQDAGNVVGVATLDGSARRRLRP
jgi:hypothetical protein